METIIVKLRNDKNWEIYNEYTSISRIRLENENTKRTSRDLQGQINLFTFLGEIEKNGAELYINNNNNIEIPKEKLAFNYIIVNSNYIKNHFPELLPSIKENSTLLIPKKYKRQEEIVSYFHRSFQNSTNTSKKFNLPYRDKKLKVNNYDYSILALDVENGNLIQNPIILVQDYENINPSEILLLLKMWVLSPL